MTTAAKRHVAAAERERSAQPAKWTVISGIVLLMAAALTAVLAPEERRPGQSPGRNPLRASGRSEIAPRKAAAEIEDRDGPRA